MSNINDENFDLASNAFSNNSILGIPADQIYVNSNFTGVELNKADTTLNIDGENLTHDMIKRMRILFDLLENDPKYKELNDDINTRIAFETLQGKKNEN